MWLQNLFTNLKKKYQGEEEQRLRIQYKKCEGGSFFSIDCIENYELIREFCSFGSNLVVLSPQKIIDEILFSARNVLLNYQKSV